MGKEMNTNDLWGIPEPYKLRDIVISAHLAKTGLLSKIPYSVSFQDLKVQIVHCNVPRQVELVLNTALVSLGYTNEAKISLIKMWLCQVKDLESFELWIKKDNYFMS